MSAREGAVVTSEGRDAAQDEREISFDVCIVGCGVAGLYAALNLPRHLRIAMLSKQDVASCDSMLAQGGICVMRDHDDYDYWFDDTMRAGHNECRPESVDTMIWSSREIINDLIRMGVEFDRTPAGDLDYTREGAHSRNRIVHHADVTGKEITTKLLARVRELRNVRIMEYTTMDDLLVKDGACVGVHARDARGEGLAIRARDTVLATGGVGGLYEHSTNYPCLTGDGCRVCQEHGVALEHMDYVQIHPTTLFSTKPGRHAAARARCSWTRTASASRTSSSRATWCLPPSGARCRKTAPGTCGSRSRTCRKRCAASTSRTFTSTALRRATISRGSRFPWCPRSTT